MLQPSPQLVYYLHLNLLIKVNLVGKKVMNPMIHCCDKCLKPILIYGRMIPCKHVFCLGCAKQEERVCPRFRPEANCHVEKWLWKSRCGDKVSRVEQAGLGNIFLCTQGGSRYIFLQLYMNYFYHPLSHFVLWLGSRPAHTQNGWWPVY